ncbi:adenylate/guanylate cyclase domain-containing protein [Ferrovibrio sp.]|uniref:adenylate/guanylate cyclase domain-containing protein n=1 Tax=Ferrovibrio sp. TaxID=1917215 RepID=UPI003D2B6BCD
MPTDAGPSSPDQKPEAPRPLPRKLTTIFCADVQGYSAQVEADEVGTVQRLKLYRSEMIQEIERHHGRVVNTWGDGLLAEFSSPVEAVFAAVEAQRRVAARNAALKLDAPGTPPLQFRIGINLGDVMVDGDDLLGDGVNIASRLEALAEAGGVCISGTVFEQVRKKLDFGFDFIGSREIKNIAEPVPAYRIQVDQPGRASAQPPIYQRPQQDDRQPYSERDEAQDSDQAIRKWRRNALRGAVVITFLALINLFTSRHSIWFHWPLMGIALMLALRYPYGVDPRRMWPLWRQD